MQAISQWNFFTLCFYLTVTVSPFLKLPWVSCSNNEKGSKKEKITFMSCLYNSLCNRPTVFIKQGKYNSIIKKENHQLKTLTLLIRTDSCQSIRKYSMWRWTRKMEQEKKKKYVKVRATVKRAKKVSQQLIPNKYVQ